MQLALLVGGYVYEQLVERVEWAMALVVDRRRELALLVGGYVYEQLVERVEWAMALVVDR